MITSFLYFVRSCRARPYIALAQTKCSHRHPLTSMAFVWGSMWTPCLTGLSSYPSFYPAYRSDRYGHAISRLDRLISSKDDYFPLSAFPHIQYLATPRCPDSVLLLPSLYQQACCNMDKANTCYSMGSSHCDCRVAGISLGFQLDALRLSAARCYVISQRRQIACRALITTQSRV